ncbi:5-bromo-4-chloroindolyl phosphate hydrolysis family protein [Falsirhodobacter sp. alg1]|uniref:5-bromo-4-chloroindolyl phosphate hydrolysis family protein n=1 Tax=Falsirhodobacter sp. alg1 TaxID=1472418 RepID=UPI000693A020|nr:5-bromo-4-chloroindolyl phosphate hydrolysis family protein [Falsirhodobacter sp. alg1]
MLPRRKNIYDGRRRLRGGTRARLLAIPAVLFFLHGFGGTSGQMLAGLAAGGLLLGASWLTREGLRAELDYEGRELARRPLPRKLAAAVLVGLALFVGGLMNGQPAFGVIFGLIGAGLHIAAFGRDPWQDKGEGRDLDRVSRAVAEGERHLAAMEASIARLDDRRLARRVAEFSAVARDLFRGVEEAPEGFSPARKYLGIYLMGARDATEKFTDLYARHPDAQARHSYEALLTDLETTFASRTAALMQNDRTDLDIEISVLRERLARE